MATLSDAKTLGGVGAILLFIPVVSLVGYILILVAMKYVSDVTRDRSVWENTLYAVILVIIGAVVGILFFVLPILFGFAIIPGTGTDPFAVFGSLIFILGFVIFWIFTVIAALFWKRALDSTAGHTGVEMFGTAGLLYLIGAAIPLIGLIIVLVANILLIIAFFSLPDELPQASAMATAPPA